MFRGLSPADELSCADFLSFLRLLNFMQEWNPGLLEEQPMILTAESSLRPGALIFTAAFYTSLISLPRAQWRKM